MPASDAGASRPAVRPRGYMGAVYKLTADFLRERGLLDEVMSKASPETRAVLEKPPFPFAWADSGPMDEIEAALHRMRGGRQLCFDLGLVAAQKMGGSVIEPVLRMALGLFGSKPATVYGNLERFYSMVTRGMTFAYEETSPTSGVVVVGAEGPGVHESLFDVTRGNLTYVLELCGVTGTVDAPAITRLDGSGASARLPVHWS